MCGTVPTAAATLYTLLAPIDDLVKLQTIVESGAGGGALAGHEIGKTNGRQDVYRIRVRFDDRSFQTVAQASLDGLGVGDSVRMSVIASAVMDPVRHAWRLPGVKPAFIHEYEEE